MSQLYYNNNRCPICGTERCSIVTGSINDPFYEYCCPQCDYILVPNYHKSNKVRDVFNLDHLHSYLFYHKNIDDRRRRVFCTREYYNSNIEGYEEVYNVSPEMVESWYPKTFFEKVNLIILALSERQQNEAQKVIFTDKKELHDLFFVTSHFEGEEKERVEANQLEFIENYFTEKQLLFIKNDLIRTIISLNYKGLELLYDLRRNQHVGNSVFVAMRFGKETKLLRDAIRNGITSAGFEAVFMDEIEHNHQIVPEMLYQIRNSRFVVAELSHHNNGAYYEAGYALGLGKEVIHICNNDSIKNGLHFDVAQINTITYDNLAELPEKLSKRIKATIG